MAAVAAMPCPAPINLTLSSSVYRARFVFPMIPPMNKITYLVMESTLRGHGQTSYWPIFYPSRP